MVYTAAMNDASDAISKAVSLNKKLAAGLIVKKEQLEADLARVRAEGGSDEALTAELAATEQQLASARTELAELQRLARQRGVPSAASIDALTANDPLTPSLEDAALERARKGINELDALAELSEPAASAAPPAPTSREDAEAKAAEEFEKLRGNPPKTKRTM